MYIYKCICIYVYIYIYIIYEYKHILILPMPLFKGRVLHLPHINPTHVWPSLRNRALAR